MTFSAACGSLASLRKMPFLCVSQSLFLSLSLCISQSLHTDNCFMQPPASLRKISFLNSLMTGKPNGEAIGLKQVGEQMREKTWWMPAWICNTTHHDHVPVTALRAWDVPDGTARVGETFSLFELTPFGWGSTRLGFKAHKGPQNGDANRDRIDVGTAMQMSGAATSASLGSVQNESWVLGMAANVFSSLGAETGRYFDWTRYSTSTTRLMGDGFVFCINGLIIFQISWMLATCEESKVVGMNTTGLFRFTGGYECIDSTAVKLSAAVTLVMIAFCIVAALFPSTVLAKFSQSCQMVKKLR